ncbi:P-loop containing nucleoside triphosphate hydrolase protein [Apiospora hydei]|uniref:P-loop containing nucleoside triphosphate hydrolase protein n=1 Tax=Apiospora hydei TaxID=1337664 RepID=A0ABR1X8V6_9PEZI
MPSPNAGRFCAAAVGSSLAAYIIRLILSNKTVGPRHAQLFLRLQQAVAKVPDLYKLATNHRLALTVPLWCDSALKLIQTLIGRYNWLKGLVLRSLTVSVTVPAHDNLSTNIQQWITQVEQPKHRYYTFTATAGGGYISNPKTGHAQPMPKNPDGRITLRPVYKDVQFWDGWRPFWIIRHTKRTAQDNTNMEDSSTTIMTLGYSTAPIMKFLDACQKLAEATHPSTKDAPVIWVFHPYADESSNWGIASARGAGFAPWGPGERKTMRRLESVYIDETVKDELVKKIGRYVNPLRSQMYSACSVPRRLGFLFHGPPGTGKTSLSLALAGKFGLPLYILDVPDVKSDTHLKVLFKTLPPSCFVLLEDIDCVGSKRVAGVTLSGLLNVLDGPNSVDGRILLMSSNHPEQLDPALIRPGRVDQKIYLSYISQACAETMFCRIYSKFREALRQIRRKEEENMTNAELRRHAADFGSRIPPGTFTPAELQVYIFDHEESPCAALEDLDDWVKEKVGNQQEGLN